MGSRARLTWLLLVLVAALAAPALGAAATLTVNTTTDTDDGACDAVHCSLREAINAANLIPGADRIEFEIPPGGFQTIRPEVRPLPQITDPVTIDGTTQDGFEGVPLIQLNGDLVVVPTGGSAPGLDFVGGFSTIRSLVIDGFKAGGGIRLRGPQNVVVGNYVGAVPGSPATSPNDYGIWAELSADNRIGGRTERERNVISGNDRSGVRLAASPRAVIQGNYVGTDARGSGGVAGVQDVGIEVGDGSHETLVGGSVAGAGNVISLNSAFGVFNGNSNGSRIEGNFIGTDASGALRLGNGTGVYIITGDGNVVGGGGANAGNVIAANQFAGVNIEGVSAAGDVSTGNAIQGNLIGAGAGGQPLGNGYGVFLHEAAAGNLVGGLGQGEGNVIAHNSLAGVNLHLLAGSGNAVLSNSIFLNGQLGIDISPTGPNPNDPGDADPGPNDLQNYPILTRVDATQVEGTLDSRPSTTYRIQIFASLACDPSGFGEGEELAAQLEVTTDETGTATFTVAVAPDEAITATATDPAGSTSEFSNCVPPPPLGPGHVTGGGQTLGSTPLGQITFGFFAKSKANGSAAKGACTVVDHGTGTHVKCLDAEVVGVVGDHATFSGRATVNGVETRYTIEVDDLGEPGIGRDRFTIRTDSGYVAGGILTAGNIKIHK